MNKQKYRITRWIKDRANFLYAVTKLGGKCCVCGENHIATLDFHHIDQAQKEFTIAFLLRDKDFSNSEDCDKVCRELQKCELLCSNCHRKKHFNSDLYEENRNEIERRAAGWKPDGERSVQRLTKDEVTQLISLHKEGCSVELIARSLARSPNTIKNKIQRLGLLQTNKKKRKSPKVVESDLVISLWDVGKKAVEIAQFLDISLNQIYRILKGDRNEQEFIPDGYDE